jgi:hypothetical protein
MKAKKKPSGVRHLLNYLEGSKGPQNKKKEKELLLKEYQSGVISLKEYQKKLEELVMK